LKLSEGLPPGRIAWIHSSKRDSRPPFRFARVWRSAPVLPRSALVSEAPPKLPQFSETEVRLSSMCGGDTTCSQTSPRSSVIDLMRLK
jgi:hypothetical protein